MELKIKNTAQTVEIVVSHLQTRGPQKAPQAGLQWQERTIYSAGPLDCAVSSKLFSADDWTLEVYQGVAPLINTVYQIALFNTKSRLFWKGSVKADGSLNEETPLKLLSEEEGRRKSEELNKRSQVPAPKPGGYGH